jgi:4-amino-4-deoxy-L-arabinose transferase-like glycosyltransferase
MSLEKFKIFLFFLIVLIATILGLPEHDGKSTYAYWETVRDLSVVQNLSAGHIIFLGPISSLGNFHFPPAYYYIVYPFAIILKFAPYSLAIASLFFSLATIILTFIVIKKWFKNDFLAFLVIFLMSISTLTIQLEKYGSNPNFIPFFGLLFFYSLQQLIETPYKLKYVTLLAVSFSIATQLHAVPMLVLPIILTVSILQKHLKVNLKTGIIFVLLTILIYSPYLFYELTHNFQNARYLLSIANSGNNLEMIATHWVQYLGFWISPFVSLHSFFDISSVLGNKFYYILISSLFFVPFILNFNLKNKKYILNQSRIIFSDSLKITFRYWFLVPTLVLLLPIGGTNNYQIYYFLIFSPLIFFLFGLGIFYLFKKGLHLMALYTLLVFLLFQFIQIILYNNFLKSFTI